ncbi:MAG: hypothetical protein AAF934_11270, partial [Bacteroidota bacterium]
VFFYALVNLISLFYLRTRYKFIKGEFTGRILLHGTLLFIGCFYTFYVFYSEDDFDRSWYVTAMVLCTVALVMASKFITESYLSRTRYLRKSIQRLIGLLFRIRSEHYEKVAVKALYAERQNVVLTEDTVEENHREFNEDFYETMRKIDL